MHMHVYDIRDSKHTRDQSLAFIWSLQIWWLNVLKDEKTGLQEQEMLDNKYAIKEWLKKSALIIFEKQCISLDPLPVKLSLLSKL